MNCQHLTLILKKSGQQFWYQCEDCPQKFHATMWDGKVQVIEPKKES